jgi:hypothetical protein
VHQLSPAGIAVLSSMSTSGQRPRVLRDAVWAGRVPAGDLPELIAFAWLRDDSPTAEVSEADWLEILSELRKPASKGVSLERSREDVLRAARPLPPDDEVLIEDLTEDEDRIFLEAILSA